MKKWMSLLLALSMLGTLAVPAWAAEPEDVEVVGDDYAETEYDRGWSDGWDAGYADSAAKALADFLAGVPISDEQTYEDGYQDGYADGMSSGYETAYSTYSEIQDRNGVPGQVNVMWNGTCISFPDVQPEIKNGRTMLPVRAVMESMDAEVSYDHAKKSVSISMEDSTVTFVIGSQTATVSSGGEENAIEMDCASYLKDNSTMVPLRFLSEACGYDVLWDQDYLTAVVVDRNGWVGDLIVQTEEDRNRISNFDALLHRTLGEKQGQKIRQTGTVSMNVQLWDNDAQKLVSYPVSGEITSWSEGMTARMEGTLNLGNLLDSETASFLLPGLQGTTVSFTMLLDEEGALYLTSPQLTSLLVGGETDVWLNIGSLSDYGISDPTDLDAGWLLINSVMQDTTDAFHLYDRLAAARTQIVDLFGDDICTPNGEGYTWTVRSDNESGFQGTTTLMPDGTGSIDLQMTQTDEFFEDSGTDVKLTAKMTPSQSEADVTVTTRFCGTDTSIIQVSVKADSETVETLPAFTLPEGATVVTTEELLYGTVPAEE